MQPAAEGKALRIEVRDTGRGISAQQRSRLFQDFERLDSPVKVEGAGLGLALSSRLVTLLGGRLDHSENPTGGSIFWMELPATTVPSALAAETESATAPAPTDPLRVLVVDDDDCVPAAPKTRKCSPRRHEEDKDTIGTKKLIALRSQGATRFVFVLQDSLRVFIFFVPSW